MYVYFYVHAFLFFFPYNSVFIAIIDCVYVPPKFMY